MQIFYVYYIWRTEGHLKAENCVIVSDSPSGPHFGFLFEERAEDK
jgi:hypothetical protein